MDISLSLNDRLVTGLVVLAGVLAAQVIYYAVVLLYRHPPSLGSVGQAVVYLAGAGVKGVILFGVPVAYHLGWIHLVPALWLTALIWLSAGEMERRNFNRRSGH